MVSTSAFVTTSTWRIHNRNNAFQPSTCKSFISSVPVQFNRANHTRVTMCDPKPTSSEDTDESASEEIITKNVEEVIFDDEIKEPYPGFFGDMKRMGMSDEEARAQALKQMKQSKPTKSNKVGGKKNLFREDGTPYAPWMAGFPSEYDNSVIKNRTDATGKLAADPQLGELSGSGLTYKMVGDDIELSWTTGSEEGNLGFVIYKRKGKSEKWEKITDYRSKPVALKSKGPEGGSYSFLIEEPEPGTWVYRVSDVDKDQNVADLSQVLIEIESAEDSKIQKIAIAGLLIVFVLAFAAGLFLDPQSL